MVEELITREPGSMQPIIEKVKLPSLTCHILPEVFQIVSDSAREVHAARYPQGAHAIGKVMHNHVGRRSDNTRHKGLHILKLPMSTVSPLGRSSPAAKHKFKPGGSPLTLHIDTDQFTLAHESGQHIEQKVYRADHCVAMTRSIVLIGVSDFF